MFYQAPTAWSASDLKMSDKWIHQLSHSELSELNSALAFCQEIDYLDLSKKAFPLPSLSKRISKHFLPELEAGPGVLLLKGLDLKNYNNQDIEKVFYGLGLHFGTPVYQTVEGEKLHKVHDQGYTRDDPKVRGTNTSYEICFHNDPCDVAALFCVRKANSGGLSRVVSSAAIHNVMLERHPELLKTLYEPFYTLRHNVNTSLEQEFTIRPIFAFENGYFTCNIC